MVDCGLRNFGEKRETAMGKSENQIYVNVSDHGKSGQIREFPLLMQDLPLKMTMGQYEVFD